jgi:hypothetical protein
LSWTRARRIGTPQSDKSFVPWGDLGRGYSSVAPPPGDNGNWKNATFYPPDMKVKPRIDFLDGV